MKKGLPRRSGRISVIRRDLSLRSGHSDCKAPLPSRKHHAEKRSSEPH